MNADSNLEPVVQEETEKTEGKPDHFEFEQGNEGSEVLGLGFSNFPIFLFKWIVEQAGRLRSHGRVARPGGHTKTAARH